MTKWIMPGAILALAMLSPGCREHRESVPEAVAPCPTVSAAISEPSVPETEAFLEPSALLHRRFALVSVDGKDFAVDEPARRPDIAFNEGFQIAGHVCNSFRGPADLRGGKLYAERLASTMMLCIKPELNELERLFHAMLRAGADIALDGNRLTLGQGGHTLVYESADWVR